MTTLGSDLVFEPKVWQDHVSAYFRQKLAYGAFAHTPAEAQAKLAESKAGDTVTFPFYGKIGAAEEPAEDTALVVDKLTDNSFTATVFEVGKAVGFTDTAYVVSGDGKVGLKDEAYAQMARVHAEKLDAKLLTEIHTANVTGYAAAAAGDTMNIKTLLRAKVEAFGDRQDEAAVCFMHSHQAYDLMSNESNGFLKADANDPLYGQAGFIGRILGMAVVSVDSTVVNADAIGGVADTYEALICKPEAYGYMSKEAMEFEMDRDILSRKDLMTCTEWYAVKNFHAKYAADDLRIAKCITTSTLTNA